jgi:hypothetical protein
MQLLWKTRATCIYTLTSVLWVVTPRKLSDYYLLLSSQPILQKNNLPWNRIISSSDLVEQLRRTWVIEWELAIQHSEQHHTQGPHVRWFAWNSMPCSLHANIRTSMFKNSSMFRDIMPYSPLRVNQCLGGTQCLTSSGLKKKPSKKAAWKQVACRAKSYTLSCLQVIPDSTEQNEYKSPQT